MAYADPIVGCNPSGWECPKCGTVWAPWVAKCSNSHASFTYTVTSPYVPSPYVQTATAPPPDAS